MGLSDRATSILIIVISIAVPALVTVLFYVSPPEFATNKDLTAEVAAGRFREDLFFRLNVVPLAVPPLSARREDIPALAAHFLELYSLDNDLPVPGLAPPALERLTAMEWRGNIRELRNMIERLAILSAGPVISAEDVEALASPLGPVPGSPGEAGVPAGARKTGPGAWSIPTLDEIQALGGLTGARREFERRCIELGLDRTAGNVSETARRLGVERSNLHKKMQALGLEAHPPRPGEPGATQEDPS